MNGEIVEIVPHDELSRCIIYDPAFDHDVHLNNVLWPFKGARKEDGAYHESAVLRRFAPQDADVHRIGCQIAASQNLKDDPEPGPDRRYYCGFRTAIFGTIPTKGEGFSVNIRHFPENGVQAHVDVAITVEGTKNARANNRTNAGLALAEIFNFPTPHRCECDETDDQHPFDRFGTDCLYRGLDNYLPLPWPLIEAI